MLTDLLNPSRDGVSSSWYEVVSLMGREVWASYGGVTGVAAGKISFVWTGWKTPSAWIETQLPADE